MIALTPYWLSSSRVFCGSRLLRCRQVVIFGRPGFFAKDSGTRWRIMRRCPTLWLSSTVSSARAQLRPAAVSEASVPLPSPPLGQHFVRALPARWRSVVAALARTIHGGYQGFTLPLRFNSRPYSHRILMDHSDRRCVGTYGSEKT